MRSSVMLRYSLTWSKVTFLGFWFFFLVLLFVVMENISNVGRSGMVPMHDIVPEFATEEYQQE